MIVSAHQSNFLPGVSVMTKIAASDLFIVCDEMEFTRYGFVNRNRFTEKDGYGGWMTVPVNHDDTFAPINKVRITDKDFRARTKISKTLENKIGSAAVPFVRELERPYRRLVGLNVALLRLLCDGLEISTPWVYQSHLESGNHEPNVSERICAMVAEVGATVYLSGPSGVNYLDETPFEKLGIEVRYHTFVGPNPTAVELLRRPMEAVA